MSATSFFERGGGLTLRELAEACDAVLSTEPVGDVRITGIATLDAAGSSDVSFFDNQRYRKDLAGSRAGAVIVGERYAAHAPATTAVLIARDPQRSFALAGRALFPDALAPAPIGAGDGVSAKAEVHPSAQLEEGVVVEAFASVGAGAHVGRGTILGPGSVVGPGCRIGRDCRIGPQVTVQHALLGDRVILHPGVQVGQDGFGYAAGANGMMKTVQIGRVILQDDVEIGANSTIDRGAVRDTVIGEGTKIDNQVQIAHNVRIGRHCVIVSQVGIAGSATLGDGVMIGGQSGVNGHVTVGDGSQIAAVSSVAGDVPPGSRWGGAPAHPVRDWLREVMWVQEMAKSGRKSRKVDE